ncbi:hypothetical protein [Serratia silvae]|uniref:Uncharacterized protein n=1 Tax=Serratia silvae TaxID=2824122 RepID=A0ABT0K7E7_9GAMM|nr:hypothetical protein [Serratia silvae]MCL1027872.1 hypothetical protein [Serratia silvae]
MRRTLEILFSSVVATIHYLFYFPNGLMENNINLMNGLPMKNSPKKKTIDNSQKQELLSQLKSPLLDSPMGDEEKLGVVMIIVLSLLECTGSSKVAMRTSNGKTLTIELANDTH